MNRTIGPYSLHHRLGSGGMADVYLAEVEREGGIHQKCVIKLLHDELTSQPQVRRTLMDEAHLIARLRHNNIAGLYDIGRDGDDYFLVMEYVEGRDLHAILSAASREDRSLSVGFALHVAANLCAGLHFAHTRIDSEGTPLNLVHRDVSPPNILISTLGEVKLIDFGVAKFASSVRHKTRSGVIKGKFGYMSPEQAWDEELDHRSDIFSVGVCIYEMLTGRSLYGQSDDAMEMLQRARSADIEPITRWRSIPPDIADLVHQTLSKKRSDRPPSAHALERQLRRLLSRHYPDYTPLDTAQVVVDLFELSEPALEGNAFPSDDDSTTRTPTPPSTPEETSRPQEATAIVTIDDSDLPPPVDDASSSPKADESGTVDRDSTHILPSLADDGPPIDERPRDSQKPTDNPDEPTPLKATSRDIFGDTEYDDVGVPILSADRKGSDLAKPNDIRRTGANPTLGVSEDDDEEGGLDRRAQIGLAALFVAAAFFILLWRLV